MSGELVLKQAKAGQDEAAGGQGAGGGCDWQATAGGRGHQASANCKVNKQRESVMCCCTLLNRVLSIRRVYLYRWRRGAFLIERLSGIDEGVDG